MMYEKFVTEVLKTTREVLNDENVMVDIYHAEKNNGVSRVGIVFKINLSNVSPIIYLEEYFLDKYTIDETVDSICRLYQKMKFKENVNVYEEDFFDYESIKSKIYYRIVNTEKNQMLLKNVPSVSYLDLSLIFYVLIEQNELHSATMLIRNEYMETWNVTKEELIKQAEKNTHRLFQTEFCSMREIIGDLIPYNEEEPSMYVLSNAYRQYGAVEMYFKETLNIVSEIVKESFYILPSSIHEVLIIPKSKIFTEVMALKEMVQDINFTQVEDEEVLSDNVYFYDKEKREVYIC